MSNTPIQLSVVVAAVSGGRHLGGCLAALEAQDAPGEVEVIVAHLGHEAGDGPRGHAVDLRTVSVAAPAGVPELRARGLTMSRGDVVAVLGDYCRPSRSWCRGVVQAHAESPAAAIGGPIAGPEPRSLADQAAFWCEYGAFAPPLEDGAVGDLPGPNVSYKRKVLESMPEQLEGGYWETFLHDELRRRGHALRCDRRLEVTNARHFGAAEFLAERFAFGRSFAAARNARSTRQRRWILALAAPLIPGVLTLRVWRRQRGKVAIGRRLAMLPYVALFMVAAAAGEWAGYVFGPGRGAERRV